MNDHELDDQIRRLAQSYNEPPATPRDAMWQAIDRTRAGAGIVAIGTSRRMRWLRMAGGVAAVLVVGIGIGRLTHDVGAPAAVASAGTAPRGDTVAGRTVPIIAAPSPAEGADAAHETLAASTPESATGNPVRATRDERIRALRAGRDDAARNGLAAYGLPRAPQGATGDGSDVSAYRLAVVEHMARAEVLLTSFVAESRNTTTDARTSAQFASLSRDLLKTTRLLLATRSTDDPALTRLLEDLELVLMQISQYTSDGRRGDLDAINQSLDRRNVLPKLRSTIPAGASASTGL